MCALLLAAQHVMAQSSVPCGSVYTIARGDTLFRVAERAYGDGHQYRSIFEANRDLLPDEASVEVGDRLLIPCLEGRGEARGRKSAAAPGSTQIADEVVPEGRGHSLKTARQATTEQHATSRSQRADAADTASGAAGQGPSAAASTFSDQDPSAPAEEPRYAAAEMTGVASDGQAVPHTATPHFKLLSGSGFGPYADEGLPDGGMIAALIDRALDLTAPEQGFRVVFIDDWSAHLEILLPEGLFDVSFPWYKPDCSEAERLSRNSRRLCDGFNFSRPFVEVPVGFYAMAGDPSLDVTDHAQLGGKRLCRPASHAPFDLERNGLSGQHLSLETPETAAACFSRLLKGRVDVVSLANHDAERAIRQLGAGEQIAEIEGLASVETLHAVTSKSNAKGARLLALIDRGLVEVMISGEWFEVIAFHNRLQSVSGN